MNIFHSLASSCLLLCPYLQKDSKMIDLIHHMYLICTITCLGIWFSMTKCLGILFLAFLAYFSDNFCSVPHLETVIQLLNHMESCQLSALSHQVYLAPCFLLSVCLFFLWVNPREVGHGSWTQIIKLHWGRSLLLWVGHLPLCLTIVGTFCKAQVAIS